MITLGLTGSMAAGKSTAGALLEAMGVPVHEADAAARAAAHLLPAAFPAARYPSIYRRGTLDRRALACLALTDPAEAARLEALIHPHVRAAQARFLVRHRRAGARMVALDVPLLFETGADALVDATVVVTAPPFLRRARALARPGVDAALFAAVEARQMPERTKCARADFVVPSGAGRAALARGLAVLVGRLTREETGALPLFPFC